MMNSQLLAFVYCHTKNLSDLERLKGKAIFFAQQRHMKIIDFCATDVITTIRLLEQTNIDVLLINNHELTRQEHHLLIAYLSQNKIPLVYFEKYDLNKL